MDKGIKELHELLKSGKIKSSDLALYSKEKSYEVQSKYNAFVTIIDNPSDKKVTDELVSGIPFGVKDNLATKDILTTGSSNTLKDYIPIFNATVVENLLNKGAIISNKTVLDEFGMGGTGTTGHTGAVLNPWDKKRICGGSSAGSACAVACALYPYALGSDTGDSIRKPASYTGVVGFKPTYGMNSRYGLFPYASSLDTVGVLTRSVEDAAIVTDAMKGQDSKDMTSWDSSNIHLTNSLTKDITGKKLFYIKELVNKDNFKDSSLEVKSTIDNFYSTIEKFKSLGVEIEEISIDKELLEAINATYLVISNAEATSNMSNLTGIIFGPRSNKDNINEMIKDYRTNGFSPLIKRRFVIGSYVLQKENQERYFKNACRVRRMIVDKFKKLFENYDGMIMPGMSSPAKHIDETKNKITYADELLDSYLVIANFGGFPSITIPSGFVNNLPVSINITSNCYQDELVLNLAYQLENIMDFKGQIAIERGIK